MSTPTPQTAISAADFVNSIGINTSIDATNTSYGSFNQVEYALAYLGVTNVRDAYQGLNDSAEFNQLAAQLGISFDFYIENSAYGMNWQIAQIEASPGMVRYVEGPNEPDVNPQSYDGLTGLAAAASEQAALYAAIHGDTALNGNGKVTPVIQTSFAQVASFTAAGNLAADANDANVHEYFANGNTPGSNIATYIALGQLVSPGEPTIATEAGYYTMPSATGVDALVQAKYDLTLLFDDWQAGISTTYLFELMDEQADPGNTNPEDHYGLFNANGTPKLAATAVHNLIALLNDPNGAAATGTLSFSLTGLPATTGHDLLMTKANGSFVLALWNDVPLWNPTTANEISVAAVPVTLTLGSVYRSVSIYDPLLGTSATATYTNVSQIALQLPDHPILVEISAVAPPQLSLVQPVLTEAAQAGQPAENLWAPILANLTETNAAYTSGLTIASIGTTGATGTVSLNPATQTLDYTAAAYNPFATMDQFTYTVSDGHGGTASGSVDLLIAPPANTTYGMTAGQMVWASASNWTLYAEAAAQILLGSSAGGDTFYGLGDTTIAAYGTGNVISATAGNHTISAGSGTTTVSLAAGNNTIYGAGTGDEIVAGAGNDLVLGPTGQTSVTLGNGNQAVGLTGAGNSVTVGIGTSVISPGSGGNEVVTVAGGNAEIFAGGTLDTIHVLGGTNVIQSSTGQATIRLDAGTNTVDAEGTGNTIIGGNGNSTIWGPAGNTTVTLGNGNNLVQLTGAGNTVSLGTGSNIVDAGSGGTANITVAGGNSQIYIQGSGNSVSLTAGSNTVVATTTASTFAATTGSNVIAVTGNTNTVTGGSLSDSIMVTGNSNMISAGLGTEAIRFTGTANTVHVGSGTDSIYDSGSANTIVLAAAGSQETQVYGAVTTNSDIFDLRTLLAGTAWNGQSSLLGSFLSFSLAGSDATLWLNTTGQVGGTLHAVADLHASGPVTLSGFLAHAII